MTMEQFDNDERGDTWFTFYSHREKREYYYEPISKTTTWVAPIQGSISRLPGSPTESRGESLYRRTILPLITKPLVAISMFLLNLILLFVWLRMGARIPFHSSAVTNSRPLTSVAHQQFKNVQKRPLEVASLLRTDGSESSHYDLHEQIGPFRAVKDDAFGEKLINFRGENVNEDICLLNVEKIGNTNLEKPLSIGDDTEQSTDDSRGDTAERNIHDNQERLNIKVAVEIYNRGSPLDQPLKSDEKSIEDIFAAALVIEDGIVVTEPNDSPQLMDEEALQIMVNEPPMKHRYDESWEDDTIIVATEPNRQTNNVAVELDENCSPLDQPSKVIDDLVVLLYEDGMVSERNKPLQLLKIDEEKNFIEGSVQPAELPFNHRRGYESREVDQCDKIILSHPNELQRLRKKLVFEFDEQIDQKMPMGDPHLSISIEEREEVAIEGEISSAVLPLNRHSYNELKKDYEPDDIIASDSDDLQRLNNKNVVEKDEVNEEARVSGDLLPINSNGQTSLETQGKNVSQADDLSSAAALEADAIIQARVRDDSHGKDCPSSTAMDSSAEATMISGEDGTRSLTTPSMQLQAPDDKMDTTGDDEKRTVEKAVHEFNQIANGISKARTTCDNGKLAGEGAIDEIEQISKGINRVRTTRDDDKRAVDGEIDEFEQIAKGIIRARTAGEVLLEKVIVQATMAGVTIDLDPDVEGPILRSLEVVFKEELFEGRVHECTFPMAGVLLRRCRNQQASIIIEH